MTNDRISDLVVAALKQALAEPVEQRLFRSGKLAGLFPSRSGVNGEAAAFALHEGLLETVRTETKGKTAIEWVRSTPRAVDFIHEHESPVRALKDLQTALQITREGVPAWLAEMHRDLQTLAARLSHETQRWSQRLEVMSQRVEEAIRRVETEAPHAANSSGPMPWLQEALVYLDRRREGGVAGGCPMPELFAALRLHHADLSLKTFHEGLRRLCDRRAVRLLPFTGQPGELPEPEYALLDGAAVLYFVAR
jgi:hypothetical protein